MEEKKLILQPRLRALADLVGEGGRLADVGTDHGYLPVYLLQAGRIASAIASDINREPLEHARRTAGEYGVRWGIEFRLCGGLEGIAPEEVDTVVIAGMGGETIAAILSAAPWVLQSDITLLLQPMSKQEFLRHWLVENGYFFLSEHLVWDKEVLYPIYIVKAGKRDPLTKGEIYGGVKLQEDPLWGDYLKIQIARLRRSYEGLQQAKGEAAKEKAEATFAALKELETIWEERNHGNGERH